ncbi:MAG TPA: hypothetical protein VL133_11340 [Devosia sp.]|nr:hypothetical protein [Devosia sp.]
MMAGAADQLSLLGWPERAELSALETRRRALIAEIARLRPKSEKRIVLAAQLRALTHEQLGAGVRGHRG